MNTLPVSVLSSLAAVLLAGSAIGSLTHSDATNIADEVCVMEAVGPFCANALLDQSQVAYGAPVPEEGDTDCWDEWSCDLTEVGLPGEYGEVEAFDDFIDATGAVHAECSLIIADTSLVVCTDGYTETS